MSEGVSPEALELLEKAAEQGLTVRVTDPWGQAHNIDAGFLLEMLEAGQKFRAQLAEQTKVWERKLFPAEIPEDLKGGTDE